MYDPSKVERYSISKYGQVVLSHHFDECSAALTEALHDLAECYKLSGHIGVSGERAQR